MATSLSIVVLLLLSSLCCIIHHTSAAAGWCYQCNSNNPRCGVYIDPSMQIDKTPCNGQCYMYMRQNILYRGCSWEYGFMAPETTYAAVHAKNGIWRFCDTPLCNSNASEILSDICNGETCDYFPFPEGCELYNLYMLCGKRCGNQMC